MSLTNPPAADPTVLVHAKTWGQLRELYQVSHVYTQAQIGIYAAGRSIRASDDVTAKAERDTIIATSDSFVALTEAMAKAKLVQPFPVVIGRASDNNANPLQALLSGFENSVMRVPTSTLESHVRLAHALFINHTALTQVAKNNQLLSGLPTDRDEDKNYIGPRLAFVYGQATVRLNSFFETLAHDRKINPASPLVRLYDAISKTSGPSNDARMSAPAFVSSQYPSTPHL